MADELDIVIGGVRYKGVVIANPGSGGGGAVTVADGADVTLGAKADTAWVSGAGSLIAIQKAVKADLDTMITALQDTTTPSPVKFDQTTQGATNGVRLTDSEYEAVAASATNQALGATGAVGDYISGLLIIPATTSPGAVSIKDGSNTAITVFTGGATSVSNLVPFFVPLGVKSVQGAWQVTTGTNVSAIGVGDFT